MAFSHQERWLEYVLSKIAEIKGTGQYDSALYKRNLKKVDVDLDDVIKRVTELEKTVKTQGETIESQAKTISDQSKTIQNQAKEITNLWNKVNSL